MMLTEAAMSAHHAIATVLNEILNGSDPKTGWLLNPGDAGLLRSLDAVSAEQASAAPSGGGAPIAAHADHLRYGLGLLNRWSRGENPFDDADWGASWRLGPVSDSEWASLRRELRQAAEEWQHCFGRLLDVDPDGWTGAVASAAHLAYHLGAIRQINSAARGPRARD
jgi:DinB family protein